MKNLSEKLNLNYCDTTVLQKEYERHLESIKRIKKEYPEYKQDIWQTPESPYYKALVAIKEKQEARKIVTDDEYRAIPMCGMAYYWSAAEGYFTVNFHYNFFNNYENQNSLINKFLDFLAVVDFTECRESEVINWLNTFKLFAEKAIKSDPLLKEKCEFITSILTAVDPIKKNKIDSLLNINRNIAPGVFDNAVRYFKNKESYFNHLEDEYQDKVSLKAKDVMKILNISRRTLTRYVKENKIIIDACINGQYKYNKKSVFDLLKNS